jgi:hypothetical protein
LENKCSAVSFFEHPSSVTFVKRSLSTTSCWSQLRSQSISHTSPPPKPPHHDQTHHNRLNLLVVARQPPHRTLARGACSTVSHFACGPPDLGECLRRYLLVTDRGSGRLYTSIPNVSHRSPRISVELPHGFQVLHVQGGRLRGECTQRVAWRHCPTRDKPNFQFIDNDTSLVISHQLLPTNLAM